MQGFIFRNSLNTLVMKKILFLLVAAMLATAGTAQEQERRQRQQREFNPEEYAVMQTERLNQALQLDSIQYQAVMIMNYADAVTMQDSINARRERNEKMRAEGKKPERTRPTEEQMKAMMELQKERELIRNELMKEILSEEQFGKYLKMQEEDRKRMRQRGQRGGMRRGEGRGR